MHPVLFLIRGLPGSGKTSLAKKIASDIGGVHLRSSMYFDTGNRGSSKSSALQQSHEWCRHKAFVYLRNGMNVVISNTFAQMWEMQPYLDLLPREDIIVLIKRNCFEANYVLPAHIKRILDRWEKYTNYEENE
jgi:predicted kinase